MTDDERDTQLFEPPRATPIPLGQPQLLVLEGREIGRRYLIEGATTIGRGEQALVRIEDAMASRVHAALRVEDNEWWLEDLESHNGTLVNGTAVRSQRIRFGDRLQIGETLFLFGHRDPLEERIRHRQKLEMLGRLGAGVAHDINNLLASILANAEMVTGLARDAQGATPEIEACLADVCIAARRGAELTRRIVDHSRHGTTPDTTVDLSAAVLEAAELVRRTFDQGIRIETTVQPGLCIRGNRAAVHQIVMNLLVNARDAMPHGGVVRAALSTMSTETPPDGVAFAGQYALLEIEDEGMGIPPEIRSRVFEPFFTTKPADRGSGLGLATVAEIVAEHGGRVAFEPRSPAGTTFRVVLPALSTRAERAPQPTPYGGAGRARQSAGQRCVLLVDDDPLVRRAIGRVLTRDGLEVLEAADGRVALAMLAAPEAEIGLVLLDLDMPELGGEATFDALRERGQLVPVLFLTGLCDEARKQSLLERGARGLLTKPCSSELLRRAVRAELGVPASAPH